VVDEHPHPSAGGGSDRPQDRGELVHSLEQLDDDPFEPQVVTPTFSTSSASCLPSTRMRLARATRAR
jgi:hypothetical protein